MSSERTPNDGRQDASAGSEKSGDGISQFISKVLDQLSLSAWLPATMLIGNVALLTQLGSQRNLDFGAALIRLTERELGIIIVLLFAVILATILTQAFQFETIRIFEGYWGSGTFRSALAGLRIRRHVRKKHKLRNRQARYVIKAAKAARADMLDKIKEMDRIQALQAILTQNAPNQAKADTLRRADNDLSWTLYCPAHHLEKVHALDARLEQYPPDNRVLPTRLGNTLRSYEERLSDLDGDLEGYVLRVHERIPLILQSQHTQFRTRLDMYCSLVYIFLTLAVIAPPLLIRVHVPYHAAGTIAGLTYLNLAIVCYGAAVTSARGYGAVLVAINDYDLAHRPDPARDSTSLNDTAS